MPRTRISELGLDFVSELEDRICKAEAVHESGEGDQIIEISRNKALMLCSIAEMIFEYREWAIEEETLLERVYNDLNQGGISIETAGKVFNWKTEKQKRASDFTHNPKEYI